MKNDNVTAAVIGALAGAGVAFAVWSYISKKLDTEMRQTLAREVPPQVRAALTQTLNSYGLTPETGARISRVLSYADRVGIL